MNRSTIFLAAAGLLATSAPAIAQPLPDPEAVRLVRHLADCSIRASRPRVDNFISGGTPSPDSDKFLRLLDDGCLPEGHPPVDARLVRGALFEALYNRDFPRATPADFAGRPALAAPEGGVNPPLDASLIRFGECIARAAPADAHRLVTAAPGGAEESSAIGALSPRLAPCMQQGLRVTFSAPMLRGVVAEALYKLSRGAARTAAR